MTTTTGNRFHLSLNVGDLNRSVKFFENLLGQPPAKCRADYAKFEVNDPPLVLSLEPMPPTGRGALNHAGFRFDSAAALVDSQRRLEMAGFKTQREEGVECCYSKQTKFWINDPDGNLWEFYTLEEDIEHRGAGQVPLQESPAKPVLPVSPTVLQPIVMNCCNTDGKADPCPPPQVATKPLVFEHFLGDPRRPAPDALYETMKLRGTFNQADAVESMGHWLAMAKAQLVAGGELVIHALTADAPLAADQLDLPGPAAFVKHVPVREEVLNALQQAGFVDLSLETFRSQPCFVRAGVELRETLIKARQPAGASGSSTATTTTPPSTAAHDPEDESTLDVIYKGPFAEIVDDRGTVYRRGVRAQVSTAAWQQLATSSLAGQFVEMPASGQAKASCSVSS